MPLLRAAVTWVVSKMSGITGFNLANFDFGFPDNWNEMTDEEQTAWFRERAGTAGGGSNNPDRIPPAVGNVDDGRTGTADPADPADPTSQVDSGLGSLFTGQNGKDVYRADERGDMVLVGTQGARGPLFDLDSNEDGLFDGYITPLPAEPVKPVEEPEPYVPPVYDPVFPEYATKPGGTPISPVAPQANPFLTKPSSIDYGYGDDNMPPGFKPTSTGMVTQQLVSYINPKTGDKWTASNGGNYDMPEGWEVDKTGQMQDDGTGFQYQPPKASVQPVNAMAPPPVSPFATPVAPPVQANPFQGGIGSFVQQPEVAQPVEPVEQPVSNNLFGGG